MRGMWTERMRGGARPWGAAAGVTLALLLGVARTGSAGEIADAQKAFLSGKYSEAIEEAGKGIESDPWREGWWRLKLRAELETGKYAEALKTYEASQARHSDSMPLRLLGFEALRLNGKTKEAAAALEEIKEVAERSPARFAEAASRVAMGKALLLSGADARQVLEGFYDKARKESPEQVEPLLASGDLALEKHDYALAAEAFRDALKKAPDDPDVHLGLARAYENDADRASAALARALELNPNHAGALLFEADNLIDREAYTAAGEVLGKVLAVNSKSARAWAYKAVLAHLAGDRAAEESHRGQALSTWTDNPEVDYLIGFKLSQKYRFAEGEAYQRRALKLDEKYRPARVQLCQDLLRLGKEGEGWKLAAEAFEADPYDVVAYNLVTLRDHLEKFRTIRSPQFLLRMEPREADVYGERAMRLLERAREKLCAKYGVDLGGPVTVEIFPKKADFAIRTFGLPGGEGFLGVCFGPVVTVNSPASRAAHPASWEAVLWHEFCHTVTLHATKNKMPRWLSEGISVYEERLENPGWGQVMNPRYRELILGNGATPVSRLSGAFLKPPTPMHLQFAYYESSMVVEYVVGRFGAAALAKVLADLAKDVPINQALAKHTEPIEKLDENFDKWLRERAEKLGGEKVDWEQPKLDLDADSTAMAGFVKAHPDNFWGLLGLGRALLAERKFKEAKAPLEKAIALHPGYAEAGGPYLLLAAACRELGETARERELLERHVALDADALEPRYRLMELAGAAKDWAGVKKYAEQAIGVNPLVAGPHRWLAQACEALGQRPGAIAARRTVLMLDPLDRAEQYYRLAKVLADEGKWSEARREVVRALEEAPRFREAHKLLLEIVAKSGGTEVPTSRHPAPDEHP